MTGRWTMGDTTTITNDDDEGMTYHPPPALQATACGVDHGLMNNNNEED